MNKDLTPPEEYPTDNWEDMVKRVRKTTAPNYKNNLFRKIIDSLYEFLVEVFGFQLYLVM